MDEAMASLRAALQDAANAAEGDSNDAEIEALRDAVDAALGVLDRLGYRVEWPEAEESVSE